MSFRLPTAAEKAILNRLLAVNFPGHRELHSQLDGAEVEAIDENGSLQFKVTSRKEADVRSRVPVEARCADSDGVMINALLHVVNGMLTELEIYKDDSSAVLKRPSAEDWRVDDE